MDSAKTWIGREDSSSDTQKLNWHFVGALLILGVYVALLIGAACDYAAGVDALAMAGGR